MVSEGDTVEIQTGMMYGIEAEVTQSNEDAVQVEFQTGATGVYYKDEVESV